MAKEYSTAKRMLAVVFVLLLFLGFIKNDPGSQLDRLSAYLKETKAETAGPAAVRSLETSYCSRIWNKSALVDINGFMAKLEGRRGLYSDMGMYLTKDRYIVSVYPPTSTDYEYEQLVDFRDFLGENGVEMLYVNEPVKYTDDSVIRREFGVESYTNRNMDRFLARIREAGVHAIDLREYMAAEGIAATDLFYRTDHHWTVPAGLWAARNIAQGLNDYCGYDVDLSIYDREKYSAKVWQKCWLGEQGWKIGRACVGLDDFTRLAPAFETSYRFKLNDGSTVAGTFDDFIDDRVLDPGNELYSTSWHYSYTARSCINTRVKNGKILLLGDSYDYVMMPFLSLSVHETDFLITRALDPDFKLREFILKNGYDTVILAYAQFMLGAHDDGPSSNANYRMFSLGS